MKFKRKTSKSAKKRYKMSGTGKMSRRSVAINHFNAKDSGKQRRQKRETKPLAKTNEKNINEILPYGFKARN
jgi:large subunit ribosomal protein L35